MTTGLVRYQETGDLYFITFSCFQRRPYLVSNESKDLVVDALERMRQWYGIFVYGYVVMPEHVHLLVSEPENEILARAIQAIKLSVSVRRSERPFWQARYYDFNVFSEKKRVEKLRYIHRNPVTRGLVTRPEGWAWSSFRHYASGVRTTVEIESSWTAARREHASSHVSESRRGAP